MSNDFTSVPNHFTSLQVMTILQLVESSAGKMKEAACFSRVSESLGRWNRL